MDETGKALVVLIFVAFVFAGLMQHLQEARDNKIANCKQKQTPNLVIACLTELAER